MKRNFESPHSRLAYLFLAAMFVFVIIGCSENSSNPVSTQTEPVRGKAKAFDRDNQNYFFKLPEGYRIIEFKVNYWLPVLGVYEKGANPNYWEVRYLSESEIEEREIELKKKKIDTPEGTSAEEKIEKAITKKEEREIPKESVVVLEVPKRYESWYQQTYDLELFDDIEMYYEKYIVSGESFPPR